MSTPEAVAGARELTFGQAINEALAEELRRDERVFVIGEDVAEAGTPFKVLSGLAAEFGTQRVVDSPISEAGITGLAVGAAMTGLRPVVDIMFGDFLTLVMDQLVNQAAKAHYMSGGSLRVPLVLRTTLGATRRSAAQHSQSLQAWVSHVPGLKVVLPSTPSDAKGLLKTAIRDDNPVVFIEDKLHYPLRGPVPEGEYTIPFGRGGRQTRRRRRHPGGHKLDGAGLAGGRRPAVRARRLGRGDRPPHHQPTGRRHDRRLGRAHRPRGRGGRGSPLLRGDRRDGGHHRRALPSTTSTRRSGGWAHATCRCRSRRRWRTSPCPRRRRSRRPRERWPARRRGIGLAVTDGDHAGPGHGPGHRHRAALAARRRASRYPPASRCWRSRPTRPPWRSSRRSTAPWPACGRPPATRCRWAR